MILLVMGHSHLMQEMFQYGVNGSSVPLIYNMLNAGGGVTSIHDTGGALMFTVDSPPTLTEWNNGSAYLYFSPCWWSS